MSDYLYLNNDNNVTIHTAEVNGTPVTSGTGTWGLLDNSGEQVATGSLSYVGNEEGFKSGDWQGVIPDDASLTEGATYTIVASISSGGSDGEWRVGRKARYRGAV